MPASKIGILFSPSYCVPLSHVYLRCRTSPEFCSKFSGPRTCSSVSVGPQNFWHVLVVFETTDHPGLLQKK